MQSNKFPGKVTRQSTKATTAVSTESGRGGQVSSHKCLINGIVA